MRRTWSGSRTRFSIPYLRALIASLRAMLGLDREAQRAAHESRLPYAHHEVGQQPQPISAFASQSRLPATLAGLYSQEPAARPLARESKLPHLARELRRKSRPHESRESQR